MKTYAFIAALGGLNSFASAAVFAEQQCLTQYGPSSVSKVSTTTSKSTITATVITGTFTYTPSTTVTPTRTKGTTSTVQTTKTVTGRPSGVFTVTSTATETSTSVSGITQATTEFTTATVTSDGTVTVAAASDFVPMASQPMVVNAGGANTKRRRAQLQQIAARQEQQDSSGVISASTSYATAVTCVSYVEKTAKTKATTTASTTRTLQAPAQTTTTSKTVTKTSTVRETPASSTSTVQTTVTETATSTTTFYSATTETATSTVINPVATEYAMCGANNIVSTVKGKKVTRLQLGYPGLGQTSAASPLECCKICAQTANCGGFALGGNTCYLSGAPWACDANRYAFHWSTGGKYGGPFAVGNANCGQGYYDGFDYANQ